MLPRRQPDLTMTSAICLLCAPCWFLFAAGMGYLLVAYVTEGAGSQFLGPLFSSVTVFIGMVHVIGLATACLLCCGIGICLWLRGTEPDDRNRRSKRSNYY